MTDPLRLTIRRVLQAHLAVLYDIRRTVRLIPSGDRRLRVGKTFRWIFLRYPFVIMVYHRQVVEFHTWNI